MWAYNLKHRILQQLFIIMFKWVFLDIRPTDLYIKMYNEN